MDWLGLNWIVMIRIPFSFHGHCTYLHFAERTSGGTCPNHVIMQLQAWPHAYPQNI